MCGLLLPWQVLCGACYCQFHSKGTLERSASISQSAPSKRSKKPLQQEEKRCSYEQCDRPSDSVRFYKIEATSNAGNQNWSSLEGKVLCAG